MVDYIKIHDRPNLLKDPRTGAILNDDKSSIENYLAQKKAIAASRTAVDNTNDLREKVEALSNDIQEIKNLLKGLVK